MAGKDGKDGGNKTTLKEKIQGGLNYRQMKKTAAKLTEKNLLDQLNANMNASNASGSGGSPPGASIAGGQPPASGGAPVPAGPGQAPPQLPPQVSQTQTTAMATSPVPDSDALANFTHYLQIAILRGGVRLDDARSTLQFDTIQHYMRAAVCNDMFAAAVAQEMDSTPAGQRLNWGLSQEEMLAERHRCLTPLEDADYRAANQMSSEGGIRKALAEKLRTSEFGEELNDREMDIIYATIFGMDWERRTDPRINAWPPVLQNVPQGSPSIPTPIEALVDFMVEVSFMARDERTSQRGRGLFIGSVIEHLCSDAKSVGGKDETGTRPLMDKSMARRLLNGYSAESIEEAVGGFRDIVEKIYSTSKNQFVQGPNTPGMLNLEDSASDQDVINAEARVIAERLAARFRILLLTLPRCTTDFDKVVRNFQDELGVRNMVVDGYVREVKKISVLWLSYAEKREAIRREQLDNSVNNDGLEILPLRLRGVESLDQEKQNIREQVSSLVDRIKAEPNMPQETKESLLVSLGEMLNEANSGYFNSTKTGIDTLINTLKSSKSYSAVGENHRYPMGRAAAMAFEELKRKSGNVEAGRLAEEEWMIALSVLESPKPQLEHVPMKRKGLWDWALDKFALHKMVKIPAKLTLGIVDWSLEGIFEPTTRFPYRALNRNEIPVMVVGPKGKVQKNWSQIDEDAEKQKARKERFWRRHTLSYRIPFPAHEPDPNHRWFRRTFTDWHFRPKRIFGMHAWSRSMLKPMLVAYSAFVVPACYSTLSASIHDSETFWGGVMNGEKAYFNRPPIISWVYKAKAPSAINRVYYGGTELIPDHFAKLDDARKGSYEKIFFHLGTINNGLPSGMSAKDAYLRNALGVAQALDEPAPLQEARKKYKATLEAANAYTYHYSPISDPQTTIGIWFTDIKVGTYNSLLYMPIERDKNFAVPAVVEAKKELDLELQKHRDSPQYKQAVEILEWLKRPENLDTVEFLQQRRTGIVVLNHHDIDPAQQCKSDKDRMLYDAQGKVQEAQKKLDATKKASKEDSEEARSASEAFDKAKARVADMEKGIMLSQPDPRAAQVCLTEIVNVEELASPFRLNPLESAKDAKLSSTDELVLHLMAYQKSGAKLDKEFLRSDKLADELYDKGFLVLRNELHDIQMFGFRDVDSARIRLEMGEEAVKYLAPLVVYGASRWYLKPQHRDDFMQAWDAAAEKDSEDEDEDAMDDDADAKMSRVAYKFLKIAPVDDESKDAKTYEKLKSILDEVKKKSAEGTPEYEGAKKALLKAESRLNRMKEAVKKGWVLDISADYERTRIVKKFADMKLDKKSVPSIDEVIDLAVKYPDLNEFLDKFLDQYTLYRLNPPNLKRFVNRLVKHSGLAGKPAGYRSDGKDEVKKKLADFDPFLDESSRPKTSQVNDAIRRNEFFIPTSAFEAKYLSDEDRLKVTSDIKIERMLRYAAKVGNVNDLVYGTLLDMFSDKKKSAFLTKYYSATDPNATEKASKKTLKVIRGLVHASMESKDPNAKPVKMLAELGITLTGDPEHPLKIDPELYEKNMPSFINKMVADDGKLLKPQKGPQKGKPKALQGKRGGK